MFQLKQILIEEINVQTPNFTEQKAALTVNTNNLLQIVDKGTKKEILAFNPRQKLSTMNRILY